MTDEQNELNIEIKARCINQDKIRDILKSKNADFKGIDHQIDTYFKVNSGRLKLREGNIENALIHYDRQNTAGPKKSKVKILKKDMDEAMKQQIKSSFEILVVVDKKREIYFIDNVKFHVDDVKNLGTFIEIEAIDSDKTIGEEKLLEQCKHYMALFEINEKDLESESYSDLLLKK